MKYLKNKKYTIINSLMKFSFVFIVAGAIAAPMVFADDTAIGKVVVTSSINNPLGENLTDIPSFVKKIIEIVLMIGIPIVVLAIIYSGFLYVQASGNPGKLKDARSALTNSLIGAALLLGAFVIAEAIGTTVEEIKSNV